MSEIQDLEDAFDLACEEVGVSDGDWEMIHSLLAPLRDKSEITRVHYDHSLRVALKAREIARFQHLEEKPLLFAGALHDVGKAQVPLKVLGRKGEWSKSDQILIEKHVVDGYRLLRGRFDFTADIMLWHHQFQPHFYPKKRARPLHPYSNASSLIIAESGRMLALADVYDAPHRTNAKFGKVLDANGIREKMISDNPDRKRLVIALYDAGIFGT